MTGWEQGALDRLTAGEWLAVRSRVASEIKAAHSQLHESTSVKIAEHLLEVGAVDVPAVAQQLIAEGVAAFERASRVLPPWVLENRTPTAAEVLDGYPGESPLSEQAVTASGGASEQDNNEGEI